MPTFQFESTLASSGGTFLFPIPNIQWFADSVMSALQEMTIPNNWRGDDETYRQYALSKAAEMLSYYKLLNFNPFPPGMIFPFGGVVPPEGYLLCDGSSYLTEEYPELFAQIGYYFGGSGDNFLVPSLFNRVVVGAGDTYAINDDGGAERVTLDVSEIPSHSHSDSGHQHTYSPPGTTGLALAPGELPVTLPNLIPGLTGSASANITDTGGGESHENMPPFLAITYIIYAGRENA